uniref:Putative secreted protein n=1 Tax=Anopheles triannulatus TaxID=58253 RepID=A0A2M4B3L7_9DIPT
MHIILVVSILCTLSRHATPLNKSEKNTRTSLSSRVFCSWSDSGSYQSRAIQTSNLTTPRRPMRGRSFSKISRGIFETMLPSFRCPRIFANSTDNGGREE